MNYREEKLTSKEYKIRYLNEIEKIISKRQDEYSTLRRNFCKDIFTKRDEYINELKSMLGWPLYDYECGDIPNSKFEKLSDHDEVEVFRVSIEVLEELSITGLFFKENSKKCPLIIAQHGGGGTPELVSGFYGDTANYHDMVTSLFKYDVNIFVPQLLLWNEEIFELDYDRKSLDMKLKSVGSSIAALEIFALMRIIDYFEKQEYVSTFGMIGLSYGGFYTMFTTAIDTRIKAAISCSFFNDRCKYSSSDWIWKNSVQKFSDSEIVSLIYPRRIFLKVGKNDVTFDSKSAIEEEKRLREMCETVGTDWYDFEVFNGNHEFHFNKDSTDAFIDSLK